MAPTQNRAQKVWASIARHAREHHESVTASYEAYYGAVTPVRGTSRVNSGASTPAAGSSRAASPSRPQLEQRRLSLDKMWQGIKKHAKEHHESVTSAHNAYWGGRY